MPIKPFFLYPIQRRFDIFLVYVLFYFKKKKPIYMKWYCFETGQSIKINEAKQLSFEVSEATHGEKKKKKERF